MPILNCAGICGLAQLCIIACPNNQLLGHPLTVQCAARMDVPDDGAPLQVVIGDESDNSRGDDESSRE